jgi:hypothetical protein
VPQPKYWRVMTKRGRKAHLTPFVANEGPVVIAARWRVPPNCHRTLPCHPIAVIDAGRGQLP